MDKLGNNGASATQTGLAGAEAPEPPSRLGPTDGIPCADELRTAYRDGLLAAGRMVRRYMGECYGENSTVIIDVDEGVQADKPTLLYVAESIERRAQSVRAPK